MSLPVFSSKDVRVAWDGQPLEGLAPDTFITAARNADVTDEEVGADGQLAISRLPDKTGTVTLTFQQNSPGNNILAGVVTRQETERLFVTGDLTIADPSGSVFARFSRAHIKTTPELDVGTSATGKTRSWVFFVENMEFESIPGSSALQAGISDYIATAIDAIFARVLL